MLVNRDHELFEKVIKNYWDYYKELEGEFLSIRRYVDFLEKNHNAFSVEFLKLFQAVCSEIDVLGKAMAQIANSGFSKKDENSNITKWWTFIQNEYTIAEGPLTQFNQSIKPVQVPLQEYKCFLLGDYEVQPWKGFVTEQYENTKKAICYRNISGSQTPSWWREYNAVKHNRITINEQDTNYEKANLGNVIKAFSALYILERALMDTVGTRDDLESFIDYSLLFVKKRRLTYGEMDKLYGIDINGIYEDGITGE